MLRSILLSLRLPWGRKELSSAMSGRASHSVDVVLCGKTGSLSLRPSRGWRSRVRSCAPALIALAGLVFLWGLGSKLSLYHHPSKHVSRITVAKLWTGPRVPQLIPASSSRHTRHSPSGAHALSATAEPPPQLVAVAAMRSGVAPRRRGTRNWLTSPRAPPPPIAA
jgi:hypothetical protein